MSKDKDSFVFYRSFHEATKDLPDELYKEVMTAIIEYALTGIELEISVVAKGFLQLVKPNIDKAAERYVIAKENGKKGGNPNFKKGKPNPYYTNKKSQKDNLKDNPKITEPLPKDNQKTTKTLGGDNLNVDVDVDVDNKYIYTHEELSHRDYLIGLLELCKEHNSVLYNRHMKKPNADYALGKIVLEIKDQYSLEEIERIIKHAAETYMVKPSYSSLDLIWLLNNIEKIKKTPKETAGGGEVGQTYSPVTTKTAEEITAGLTTLALEDIV